MMLIAHLVNSDWLYNTQSRELQADWFILEINEKATLQIIICKDLLKYGELSTQLFSLIGHSKCRIFRMIHIHLKNENCHE